MIIIIFTKGKNKVHRQVKSHLNYFDDENLELCVCGQHDSCSKHLTFRASLYSRINIYNLHIPYSLYTYVPSMKEILIPKWYYIYSKIWCHCTGIRIQFEAVCSLQYETKFDSRVNFHKRTLNVISKYDSDSEGYQISPVMVELIENRRMKNILLSPNLNSNFKCYL